jgi:hypothetical protein
LKLRLITAMAAYAMLAAMAAFTLQGLFRAAVWVFLGGLAAKTWISVARDRQE